MTRLIQQAVVSTRQAMVPPDFVHKFIAWTETGHVSQEYVQRQRPAGIFRGRGQRLGGN